MDTVIAIVSPHQNAEYQPELIWRMLGGCVTQEQIICFDSGEAVLASSNHFQVYVLDEFAGGPGDEGTTWQPHLAAIRRHDPNATVILYSAFSSDESLARAEGIKFFSMGGSYRVLCDLIKQHVHC